MRILFLALVATFLTISASAQPNAAAPSPADCNARTLGVTYVRSIAGVLNSSSYTCSATGANTYAWAGPFSTAGSSGGGTWGSITGPLSSQTDLNTALGLKAPLASPTFTGNVAIGNTLSVAGLITGGNPPTISINSTTGLTTISAVDPLATIYYTIDGSTPTSASRLYQGPFTLPASATTTVQAVAYLAPASSAASQSATIGTGYDALTTTWIAAVAANSGTLTTAQTTAVDVFVKSLRSAGLVSKLVWVNPRTGNYLASKVPIIGSTNETWHNFTSSDYSLATGLTGDGSSKYLDTGLNGLTAGLSASGASVFANVVSATSDANQVLISAGNGSGTYLYLWPYYAGGPRGNMFGSTSTTSYTYASPTPGLIVLSRQSSTDLRMYRNGIQITPTMAISDSSVAPNTTIQMFRDSNFSGSYSSASMTVAGIGLGLSTSDVANLNSAVQALEATLGR
jgi:Chitobiase/beta-hexosaminidase C-terminal domain